jgi:hypothetical protein
MPLPAHAQAVSPADAPRVSVAAGAGIVDPFHGDLNFIAPAWEASVRFRVGKIVHLEVGGSRWWHIEESVRLNQIINGPNGPIGTIDRIEERSHRSQLAVEVNLLASGAVGRVSVWGGGGAALLQHKRVFSQTLTGCNLPAPSTCQDVENTFSSGDAAFLGAGGLDVRLASHVSIYGAVRLTIPSKDVGSSEVRVVVGARVGLR